MSLRASILLGWLLVVSGCSRQETPPPQPPPSVVPSTLPGRYLIRLGQAADRYRAGARWCYLDVTLAEGAPQAEAWRPDEQEIACTKLYVRRDVVVVTIARSFEQAGVAVQERWLLRGRLAGSALRGMARLTIESGEDLARTHAVRFEGVRVTSDEVDADQEAFAAHETNRATTAAAVRVRPERPLRRREDPTMEYRRMRGSRVGE